MNEHGVERFLQLRQNETMRPHTRRMARRGRVSGSAPQPSSVREKKGYSEALALAAIVSSSQDAIIAKTHDGIITSWNDGATRLYGRSADETIGKSIELTMPPEVHAEETARRAQVASGAAHSGYRCVRLRSDGSRIEVVMSMSPISDRSGRVTGIFSISRRIGDQEQADIRFGSLIEAAPDAMVCVDEAGLIVFVNARVTALFGYDREELIGMPVETLLADELRERHVHHREGFFRLPQPRAMGANQDLNALRRDGSTFPVEVSLAGLNDHGATVAIAAIRDVTDQRAIAASLRLANEAKNEFLSRMSHELRTPLNAVLGFSQLLEIQLHGTDHGESARHVIRAGRHLLNLINDVLDIARIEAGEMSVSLEAIRVAQIVDEAVTLMQPLAEAAGVSLVVVGGTAHQYVVADSQRLRQILLNLISNAVKYNHPAGSVWLSWTTEAQSVSVAVQDDGPGIAPDLQARLFTPFDRLGAEGGTIEGTGIGLAVTRGLAELMNGSISAESAIGRGSTFSVVLPAADEPATLAVDDSAEQEALIVRPPADRALVTLLYVEDNEANVRLMESLLEHRPEWQLIHAGTATIGLELARSHRPDLVLLDVHLPDGSGDDVLAALRADEATADTRVVVLSADASDAQISRLLSAGASQYLTKPFDVGEMLALLDTIAGEAPAALAPR